MTQEPVRKIPCEVYSRDEGSVWTEAELEEAAQRSLAETPLDPATFFAE